MNNPNSNRSMIFAVVGGYLLYLAYDMFKGLRDGEATTMPTWLLVVFIVLFAAIGAALIVFAWKYWKKGREGREEDRVEIPEEESAGKDGQEDPKE